MDDVFGGLEQPEPSDFGAQDFQAAQSFEAAQNFESDTPTGNVAEFAAITLDSHAGPAPSVSCGDVLTGYASWSSKQKVRTVKIQLRFWTEGRGTTDTGTVGQIELPGAPNGSEPFRFEVPASGPMSYYGDMITIRWAIVLTLDVPRRRDTTAEQPLNVMPHPS